MPYRDSKDSENAELRQRLARYAEDNRRLRERRPVDWDFSCWSIQAWFVVWGALAFVGLLILGFVALGGGADRSISAVLSAPLAIFMASLYRAMPRQ